MLAVKTKLRVEPRISTPGRVSQPHLFGTVKGFEKGLRQRSAVIVKQGSGAQHYSEGTDAACAQELPCPVCLCFSVSKSKELSPGSGQKGSPGSIQGTACPGTQLGPQPAASPSQLPADQSPHTLRKGRSPPSDHS